MRTNCLTCACSVNKTLDYIQKVIRDKSQAIWLCLEQDTLQEMSGISEGYFHEQKQTTEVQV